MGTLKPLKRPCFDFCRTNFLSLSLFLQLHFLHRGAILHQQDFYHQAHTAARPCSDRPGQEEELKRRGVHKRGAQRSRTSGSKQLTTVYIILHSLLYQGHRPSCIVTIKSHSIYKSESQCFVYLEISFVIHCYVATLIVALISLPSL